MTFVKNAAIRAELAKVGMTMTRLAELKGLSKQELSIAINTAEWSVKERNDTIQLIRDNVGR
jgi:lambda repressor-like predicted transcriptional regulator